MEVWETLRLGWPVPYLSGRSLCEFPNVHLMSAEGTTYSLNRAVLAAASHLFSKLLSDDTNLDGDALVTTDLPDDHLLLVCEFVTTGAVSVSSMDCDLTESFSALGVTLKDKYLHQYPVVKTEEETFAEYMADNAPLKQRGSGSKKTAKKLRAVSTKDMENCFVRLDRDTNLDNSFKVQEVAAQVHQLHFTCTT